MKTLSPFSSTTQTQSVHLKAAAHLLSAQQVLLEFELHGDLQNILWPAPNFVESREDNLWKHTCLEAFFGQGNQPEDPYLEINCAPNGNWNAYSFGSYRETMTTSNTTKVRLLHRDSDGDLLRFQIEVSSEAPLSFTHVGLTAVIEFANGEISYWALSHQGPKADFHNKDGWMALSTH